MTDHNARSADGRTDDFADVAAQFAKTFSVWKIRLPAKNFKSRTRGKILKAGWVIWYLFGEDERGEYLDYYSSHRHPGDSHVRLRPNRVQEHLFGASTFRFRSDDPDEDDRLQAEYDAAHVKLAEIRKEKGFTFDGEEPGGVLINDFLRSGQKD